MARLIIRTLLQGVLLLLLVTALTFALQSLIPGDPARAILGTGATEQQYLELREQLGLDDPLWLRYVNYWAGVFQGDLGTTMATNIPVGELVVQRLPVTLSLLVLGTLVTILVGVTLGVLSSRSGKGGAVVDVVSLLGLAIPNFWIAIMLVTLFAVTIPLFPATGYVKLEQSPLGWAQALVLPTIAASLTGAAIVAKTTRDSIADSMSGLWVRTLRASGASEGRILWRHALRNAAIPVLSVGHVVFVGLLGASVFIESVFALPGLGSLMVRSVTGHELYVVLGVVLVYTVLVVIANLLTELGYSWANPRVRRAS